MNKDKNAVVIVAAGSGSRARIKQSDLPKQYCKVGGRSVLQHTLDRFIDCADIHHISVVISSEAKGHYYGATEKHPKLLDPVIGGENRQESCLNGLQALSDLSPEKVLIHDAARPYVSNGIIYSVLNHIKPNIAALPASALSDTVKLAKKHNDELTVEKTIPRENLYTAQTPQGFIFKDILEAHMKAQSDGNINFTDDAAVAEWAGMSVNLIPNDERNDKITNATDLKNARERLTVNKNSIPDVRNGTGYDVHRLVDGDGLVLCGIPIDFDRKLDGHSDADVAMHALTDALLGTIVDGDIGSHFPPSDPKWKDAVSDKFLEYACKLIQKANGVITHMDVTIICEAPKIGPHRDKMRKSLSKITKVDVERISVKATTHEEIGTIGRGEGIAAMASATVVIQHGS